MLSPRLGLRLLERPSRVEAALWRRLRLEHEDKCREALFELYFPLARAIAAREFRGRPCNGMERRDFEQLACSGLLEAIDHFDPLRGAPFQSYAKHRIRGAIADGAIMASEAGAQHHHRRRMEAERLQSIRPEVDSGEVDFVSQVADIAAALALGMIAESAKHNHAPMIAGLGYQSLAWRDLELSVLREIDRLPEPEKYIMQQHYLNGLAFTQIAKLLGLSKGRISQLHRAAIQRLRERIKYSE